MSRAVLASIRPWWCYHISQGEKTVEVRKNVPKIETPFKVYIYCTNTKPFLVWGDVFRGNWETEFTFLSGYSREKAEKIWDLFNGNVMGEFTCEKVENFTTDYRMNREQTERIAKDSCLTMTELMEYEGNSPCLYGWHISNLVIYDDPKKLSDFGLRRPPQSWCYVEEGSE